MKKSLLTKRSFLAGTFALALSGCISSIPSPVVTPPAPVQPSPSNIALDPGIFYGANGIRARVKQVGRNFTVQNLTGHNGPEDLYVDQGGNRYTGPGGYYIEVQSPVLFKWRGPHGFKIMHDNRSDAS